MINHPNSPSRRFDDYDAERLAQQAEADAAFDLAIASGRLSADPKADNYAGNYMYMGRNVGGTADAFKHILTRRYLK